MYRSERRPLLTINSEAFLQDYELTYHPGRNTDVWEVLNVKINKKLLDKSDFCIVNYDRVNRQNFVPINGKNEMLPSYEYALKKKVSIINFADNSVDEFLEAVYI